jgi:hypothetical protein
LGGRARAPGRPAGLAGLWVQQALQGDHVFPGRGRPQPPPLVVVVGVGVSALGVEGMAQVLDQPPQPGWVQPPRRRHQGRLSLGHDLGGQVSGAMSQGRWRGRPRAPPGQGLGGGGEGPRNNRSGGPRDRAGGGVAEAQPVAQPTRRRGPRAPRGRPRRRRRRRPRPAHLSQWPSRRSASRRRRWTRWARTGWGSRRRSWVARWSRSAVRRPAGPAAGRSAGRGAHMNRCSGPWRQPTNWTREGKHQTEFVENYFGLIAPGNPGRERRRTLGRGPGPSCPATARGRTTRSRCQARAEGRPSRPTAPAPTRGSQRPDPPWPASE